MDDWESFLIKLIQPPITEIHLERGREIKEILESLSKYPFDPVNKFRNLKESRDLARDEIRGAAQRYIYGNFVDSIIWSCFSVEFGLLVKLDETLPEIEKKKVPKPFTLGKIIDWASPASPKTPNGKGILDNEGQKIAKEILELRNVHIHGSNFISALILSYQGVLKQLSLESIEQGLKTMLELFPEEPIKSLLEKYKPSDFVATFKIVQSISTFEWCADKRRIRSVRKEVDNLMAKVASSFLQGDFEKLPVYLQEDYFLKKRALRAIRNAHLILRKINIL